MTNKELRRLSRRDLLEMLLDVSKENERLREEVEQLQGQISRFLTDHNRQNAHSAQLKDTARIKKQ